MNLTVKKVLAGMLCLAAVWGLYGCGNQAGTPDKDTFYVDIKQDADSKVYGIHYEYYLGDEAVGGGMAGNADGSAIKKGDVLSKDFVPLDFTEEADLSQFRIEFFVVHGDGSEDKAGEAVEISPEYGKKYDVAITGSAAEGYAAEYLGRKL